MRELQGLVSVFNYFTMGGEQVILKMSRMLDRVGLSYKQEKKRDWKRMNDGAKALAMQIDKFSNEYFNITIKTKDTISDEVRAAAMWVCRMLLRLINAKDSEALADEFEAKLKTVKSKKEISEETIEDFNIR